jgi:hypothetical protein
VNARVRQIEEYDAYNLGRRASVSSVLADFNDQTTSSGCVENTRESRQCHRAAVTVLRHKRSVYHVLDVIVA